MIVEIRNYRLVASRREEFIDLFEGRLVHSQEALGMGVPGRFTVVGAPNRFVWLRTFADMPSRRVALERFYTGPVWRRHGPLANEIITDSDDVVLLRPSMTSPDLLGGYRPRPSRPRDPRRGGGRVVLAAITRLAGSAGDVEPPVAEALERAARNLGVRELGRLVTEPTPNDFPRLPVRQEPGTFVWLVDAMGGEAAPADAMAAADGAIERALGDAIDAPVRTLVLEPTTRSYLPA